MRNELSSPSRRRASMRRAAGFVLMAAACGLVGARAFCAEGATARFSVPMDDVEILAPLPSWANARKDFGAKGDGVTDDSDALQKALDALGHPGQANILYLPAGIYRITRTLHWNGNFPGPTGTTLIGESADSTSIVWDGPQGGTMLVQNGGIFFRYARLTWDGRRKAGTGVAQLWNMHSGTVFGGNTEHEDEVFQDMGIGIMAGRLGKDYGNLDSEGVIRRVTFLRNTYAGFDTGSWNALDWWIWDSRFIDCARGASNTYALSDSGATEGAGAFYIYRSLFQRSTVADVDVGNTGWFSLYHNTSVGSRRFFQARPLGRNGAPTLLMGNKVLDTVDPVSIIDGNLGLLTLIDNQIRSRPGVQGPVVVMNDFLNGRSSLSLGNRYTVKQPFDFQGAKPSTEDRRVTVDDVTVGADEISSALPELPPTPPMVHRKIFEVVLGADGARNAMAIQAAVDRAAKAAAHGEFNPVVHLPIGKYYVSRTVEVPATVRMQIAGDGMVSTLNWNGHGDGPVFHLQGPSLATIRDLQIWSPPAVASIAITQADQPGGRIFIEGSTPGPVKAKDVTQTQLATQACPGIRSVSLDNVGSWASVASGVIGPVTSTHNAGDAKVLFADTWYEGTDTHLYRVDSGNFTYVGGQIGPATHPGTAPTILDDPAIAVRSANGKVVFMNFKLILNRIPAGVGIDIPQDERNQHQVLVMGVDTYTNSEKGYMRRQRSDASVGMALSGIHNARQGYRPAADEGRTDPAFMRQMLSELRSLAWDTRPYQAPAGATDVRLYRFAGQNSGGVTILH